MTWIKPYTRFIILVIAGLAGVVAAGLTAVLQDNSVNSSIFKLTLT